VQGALAVPTAAASLETAAPIRSSAPAATEPQLPATGAASGSLALLAAIVLALGFALVVAGRRPSIR
jgi:LPXTG-motif cell wall-anchored protein